MAITVGTLTLPTTGTDPKVATKETTEAAVEGLVQGVVNQLGTAAEMDADALPVSPDQTAAIAAATTAVKIGETLFAGNVKAAPLLDDHIYIADSTDGINPNSPKPALLSSLPISTATQIALTGLDTDMALRETDAFASVVLDQDGNILHLVRTDGTVLNGSDAGTSTTERETPAFQTVRMDQDGNVLALVTANGRPVVSAFAGDDELGEYFRATDAFEHITTDLNGQIVDVVSGRGVDPVAITTGELNLMLVYGQSPFLGSDTTAISTTPVAGLKMFNGGSLMTSGEWGNPVNFASVVDHVTDGQEDGSRGAAEGFLAAMGSFTDTLVTVTACQGGRTAVELSKGGGFFERLETAIDALAAIADAGQFAKGIVPVVFWQGEADISRMTSPTVWRRQIEQGIRLPLQAKVDEVFGEGNTVVMVMLPPSSAFYYNKSDMSLAVAIERLCRDDPHYVYGGTTYQYDYGAGGVGSHLLTGGDVKRAAFSGGYAAGQVVLGEQVSAVQAVRARRASAKVIEIEYTVPELPLVLDTVTITDPGNYGYQIERADNGEALGIASVAISRGKYIKIVSASDLPLVPLRVKYAWIGGALDDGDPDPFGSWAGRTTGQRGCLRDSTSRTVDVSGTPVTEPHFAPITEINVE